MGEIKTAFVIGMRPNKETVDRFRSEYSIDLRWFEWSLDHNTIRKNILALTDLMGKCDAVLLAPGWNHKKAFVEKMEFAISRVTDHPLLIERHGVLLEFTNERERGSLELVEMPCRITKRQEVKRDIHL